jgi:hypothetical protein
MSEGERAMRLTKEQEIQATEKLIEMLDGAYRCPPHRGLDTGQIRAALNGELSCSQITRLLRKSGKAHDPNGHRQGYIYFWQLTPDELRKRFTYSGNAA